MLRWLTDRTIDAGLAHRVDPSTLLDQIMPGRGDARAQASSFWVLLIASAYISACGVVVESTAVIIGAMVIAPLGMPIFGIGASLVSREPLWPPMRRVLLAMVAAVAIGVLVEATSINRVATLENVQVIARTQPSLIDLGVAFATGFVGAMALVRTDIAPALSGVAIAISLVPPLSVVGICLGDGEWGSAFGAAVLFGTNVLAIVLAAIAVFSATSLQLSHADGTRRGRRTIWLVTGVFVLLLTVSSAVTGLLTYEQQTVSAAAQAWAANEPEWEYVSSQRQGTDTYIVRFVGTGEPPQSAVGQLRTRIEQDIFGGATVSIRFEQGATFEAVSDRVRAVEDR